MDYGGVLDVGQGRVAAVGVSGVVLGVATTLFSTLVLYGYIRSRSALNRSAIGGSGACSPLAIGTTVGSRRRGIVDCFCRNTGRTAKVTCGKSADGAALAANTAKVKVVGLIVKIRHN